MKGVLLSIICIGLAVRCQAQWVQFSPTNYLVEVSFSLDDRPTTNQFDVGHTVVGFYIHHNKIGQWCSIHNWSQKGGHTPTTNVTEVTEKAARCVKLLKPLPQPAHLPKSPNQIVTVRAVDGTNVIEKKFPITEVPPELREILAVIGYPDVGSNRLTFIQKPEPEVRP